MGSKTGNLQELPERAIERAVIHRCGQWAPRGGDHPADLRISQCLAQNFHAYQPAAAEHQQGLACVVVVHVVTPIRGGCGAGHVPLCRGAYSVKRSGTPLASR